MQILGDKQVSSQSKLLKAIQLESSCFFRRLAYVLVSDFLRNQLSLSPMISVAASVSLPFAQLSGNFPWIRYGTVLIACSIFKH